MSIKHCKFVLKIVKIINKQTNKLNSKLFYNIIRHFLYVGIFLTDRIIFDWNFVFAKESFLTETLFFALLLRLRPGLMLARLSARLASKPFEPWGWTLNRIGHIIKFSHQCKFQALKTAPRECKLARKNAYDFCDQHIKIDRNAHVRFKSFISRFKWLTCKPKLK